MIPLRIFYDENLDRSKLSEQKNTFEFIVPPPSREFGTIIEQQKSTSMSLLLMCEILLMCH